MQSFHRYSLVKWSHRERERVKSKRVSVLFWSPTGQQTAVCVCEDQLCDSKPDKYHIWWIFFHYTKTVLAKLPSVMNSARCIFLWIQWNTVLFLKFKLHLTYTEQHFNSLTVTDVEWLSFSLWFTAESEEMCIGVGKEKCGFFFCIC